MATKATQFPHVGRDNRKARGRDKGKVPIRRVGRGDNRTGGAVGGGESTKVHRRTEYDRMESHDKDEQGLKAYLEHIWRNWGVKNPVHKARWVRSKDV